MNEPSLRKTIELFQQNEEEDGGEQIRKDKENEETKRRKERMKENEEGGEQIRKGKENEELKRRK